MGILEISLVIIVLIGVILYYRKHRRVQLLREMIEKVIAFEIEFDSLKRSDDTLREEMGVFKLNVGVTMYETYISMLGNLNEKMLVNTKSRSVLMPMIEDLQNNLLVEDIVRPVQLRGERLRCDLLRCDFVKQYVTKMLKQKHSHFPGLKALSAEVKNIDKRISK